MTTTTNQERDEAMSEETENVPVDETGKPNPDGYFVPQPAMDKAVARQSGYTGDQCLTCNSMRMRIAGHCMVCEECGTTTGCS
jgi:ribonucleoside-diphosphate reductase alpha chain